MFFQFEEFDLGNKIGIKISDNYVIRLCLPADFPLAQREAWNHFLGLVGYSVNRFPQKEKDELFRRCFLKDKPPIRSDDPSKVTFDLLRNMTQETQARRQCPQRVGQVCLARTTQKHKYKPYNL